MVREYRHDSMFQLHKRKYSPLKMKRSAAKELMVSGWSNCGAFYGWRASGMKTWMRQAEGQWSFRQKNSEVGSGRQKARRKFVNE